MPLQRPTNSLKQLGENRLDLIKNMIRGGSSEDAILTLLKDEKYLELLASDRYASITAMKAGEYGVTFGAERDLSKLVEYGIDTLGKAYAYLNGLENKELIEAAIIGFQVASGGPLAVFKSMLASVATGYLTREIAENIVLGNMYGGRSIDETYDFLYETHNGSTLSKELEKLNNRLGGVQLGFDIVAGIGINAIAGGIKVVGKSPIVRGTKVTGIDYVDPFTKVRLPSTVDVQPTLDRIAKGIKDPHRNDGGPFSNNGNPLPVHDTGYYSEYVIRTPGIEKAGPQRLVIGKGGETYYTPDHYDSFIKIR